MHLLYFIFFRFDMIRLDEFELMIGEEVLISRCLLPNSGMALIAKKAAMATDVESIRWRRRLLIKNCDFHPSILGFVL